MKNTFALVALVWMLALPGFVLTACTDPAASEQAEQATLTTLNFSVQGMHCSGCVSSVHNAIARIDGVASCDVSLDEEAAVVQVTDEQVAQQIVDAVSNLDYTIERVE